MTCVYSALLLSLLAEMLVAGFLRDRIETMVYANNHYAGYAPDTVEQLQALINNGTIR